MAKYDWPTAENRRVIGTRQSRLDGPAKTTGTAKYAYDMNRSGMLYAKTCHSPFGKAIVKSVDVSAAEKTPGVAAVQVAVKTDGTQEIRYAGEIIAVVAAETEEIAAEAVRKIKVEYDVQPPQLDDRDPEKADRKPEPREEGKIAEALAESGLVIHEATYEIRDIAHCCLEAHGQTCEFQGDSVMVWPSTQNVSRYADGIKDAAQIDLTKIKVDCQYMGGGFGSKFSADQWGALCTALAKQTGKPVKLMLDRDIELMSAGARPSGFAKVKIGGRKDGTITAWDCDSVTSGGFAGGSNMRLPYVFTKIPNTRNLQFGVKTNRGAQRPWRAPNHPQSCFVTMAAAADFAAKIGMDELEFFKKAAELTDRPDVYIKELDIAAEMIGYKSKAHPRGDKTKGPIKRGLGVSLHTWGGAGHPSECEAIINPDGSTEVRIGTQDLGSGTRTTVTMVAAETFGLPISAVKASIGKNEYPPSGASGGSSTIGGVSASTRMAATDALNALFAKIAPDLGVAPDQLEAKDGKISVVGNPSKSMDWKKACSKLGTAPISVRAKGETQKNAEMKLTDTGVGGVQIADVSVDIETGIVTMNEYVAVQDCGLIIDLKTAESQVYGAMIMGVTYALYEESIYEPITGRMLNSDMEFYRLAGFGDVGKLKVHMMTGPGFDERGVIGLGEPPVVSPGAVISNAVANATGVRVPEIPLTPDRVLRALMKGGVVV
jgi:xanthine dehydrogenase YagR molybdenum-binding subunit